MSSSAKSDRRGVLTRSLEHAVVGDAMHPGILSCPPEAAATKVARMMAAHQVHCIFVMRPEFAGSGDSYVWGIISELDLMEAVLRSDDAQTAGSLAHQPVVCVKPTMHLTDACALMVQHQVSHLAVVDADKPRPIGVLSTTDVADVFAWGEG